MSQDRVSILEVIYEDFTSLLTHLIVYSVPIVLMCVALRKRGEELFHYFIEQLTFKK